MISLYGSAEIQNHLLSLLTTNQQLILLTKNRKIMDIVMIKRFRIFVFAKSKYRHIVCVFKHFDVVRVRLYLIEMKGEEER